MNKKLLLIPIFVLSACGGTTALSSNEFISSSLSTSLESSSFSSASSSEISSGKSSVKSSSKNASSSSSRRGMSIVISSRSSISYSESSEDLNALTSKQIEDVFASGHAHDDEVTSLDVTKYDILLKYYTKQTYSSRKYQNNITIDSGKSVYTDFYSGEKLESNFKRQIMYKDGELSEIKKYDSTFINTATKKRCDVNEANYSLTLGQCLYAYSLYTNLKTNKNKIVDARITEDGEYYISISYYNEMDEEGYCLAGGMEITLDHNYFVTDFFYTEGTYDYMYVDSIKRMRKHGPAPYGAGGITYEVTNLDYLDFANYDDELIFKLEDNFIKSVSFKNPAETVSKSKGYIDLYDYIITDPLGGETSGCPYNNLVFTSSDANIASVDSHYLDLNKIGEVDITVRDKITGATSTTPLHITIE